jgi:hypothetical protein
VGTVFIALCVVFVVLIIGLVVWAFWPMPKPRVQVIHPEQRSEAVSLQELIDQAKKDRRIKRDLDRVVNPGRAFIDEAEDSAREEAAKRLQRKLRNARADRYEADLADALGSKAEDPKP